MPIARRIRSLLSISTLLLLLSCGGGGGSGGSGGDTGGISASETPANEPLSAPVTAPQASRLLAQASFGATAKDIDHVAALGYRAWVNEQLAKPQTLHRAYMDDMPAGTTQSAAQLRFYESFWKQAITGEDQLRQRVAYALSQIFVVSFIDSGTPNYPRGVASYYDTLAAHAFGNYRQLLEAVALHPMMGLYLSHIRNQKESGSRVPDENFAREVMQLFSIGLYELNQDGTPKLAGGKPIETYSSDDIAGLAKVFTGWSWAGPDKSNNRFFGANPDPDRDWRPMQSYPQYHSGSEKQFLGTVVASGASPEASLKIALDRLFQHPNVGPFIGRQLIQRLVTSNPSPQYVARVAAAFANNGAGVRGDMKAVVKAILLDPEARNDSAAGTAAGKLREPALRLAHWMRAFNAKAASGRYPVSVLDDPLNSLGQTPMRSPSVFNFYRPGYVPPNGAIAATGLVAPEMQITGETSVVGYLNTMRDAIQNGTGIDHAIKADYSAELALVEQPEKLVDHLNLLLMAGQMSAALRAQIVAAVNAVPIPSNASAAALARLNRARLAIFLAMAAPEYIVQK
jgi:uncharacterized protein (DUF1800 family)